MRVRFYANQRLETRSFRCVSRAFLRRRTGNWLVVRATSRVSGAPEFVYRGLTLPRKATRRFSFRPCPFPLRASSSFEISYAVSTLRGIGLTRLSAMFYGPGSRKRKKKERQVRLFFRNIILSSKVSFCYDNHLNKKLERRFMDDVTVYVFINIVLWNEKMYHYY